MSTEYTANSIDYLEGLEQIRRRPDMYLGSTTGEQPQALYRMLREIIDKNCAASILQGCAVILLYA